ncbi:MAG: hypothetical protein AAF378_01800 [Cyanobacteria bacterium P01_A01_bin.84]
MMQTFHSYEAMKIWISIAAFALSLLLTLAISSDETVNAQSVVKSNIESESLIESIEATPTENLIEGEQDILLNIFDDFTNEAPELSFD